VLNLAYSPALPPEMLREMERAARDLGLPLATVERIGQSQSLCSAFVAAARRGERGRMQFLAGLASELLGTAPTPTPPG
jgi:hypothetical protein